MHFEEAIRQAAHTASNAADLVMSMYRDGELTDEDDISGALVGALRSSLTGQIEGLRWRSSVLRHRRGVAAEENFVGADMIYNVSIDIPDLSYNKGVLIQAKRLEKGILLPTKAHKDLKDQCEKMLNITPSSFVFNYTKNAVRCGPATRILGSNKRNIYDDCIMTSYRFFSDLFRCPIGDPRITSARAQELPAPIILEMQARLD